MGEWGRSGHRRAAAGGPPPTAIGPLMSHGSAGTVTVVASPEDG